MVVAEATMSENADLERLKQDLDVRGYAIVRDRIPRARADAMAERLRELMRRMPDSEHRGFQNLHGVLNAVDGAEDVELFSPLCDDPVVLALARHALGDGFQMSATGALWLKAGSGACGAGWHADVPTDWFARNQRPRVQLTMAINCLWMVTDFSAANGATRVVPFSHHAPFEPRQYPRADYEYAVSAEGSAGSCVVLNNALWHCAGANTSDRDRIGLSVPYFPQWLDGSNVGWPAIPRRIHKLLPESVRRLHRHVVEDSPALQPLQEAYAR
jgi:ectoine hydroxylase-related dioxygenase (phytanoyl-CoA dioxygenase family)